MTMAQLEKRVAVLEVRVASLPKKFDNSMESWIADAGVFGDDPIFAEIVRLGREYRESLRPKPRRTKVGK